MHAEDTNPHLAALTQRILASQSEVRSRINVTMGAVMHLYVPTASDDMADEEVDLMMDSVLLERGVQPGVEPPEGIIRGGRALLVIANAGAGKSRLLSHLYHRRPEFAGFGVEGAYCPLISLNAPSPLTLRQLGNAILKALGYPLIRPLSESEVWPVVHEQLEANGVCFVHIDEMQHTDEITSDAEFRKIENTLKEMMQQRKWPVWLILSGTPELGRFFQADPSMRRRVRSLELRDLSFRTDTGVVRKVIREFLGKCPGMTGEDVMADGFIARLLHASLNQFGIMIEFVQDAIREALTCGHTELKVDHFADVYAARAGSPDELNVFLVDAWETIDVASSLLADEIDVNGVPTGRKVWKPRMGGRQ